MELLNVCSPEFRPYGRVISGYDVSGLMKAMESTPLPEAGNCLTGFMGRWESSWDTATAIIKN